MVRRLVFDPELCVPDGELGDHFLVGGVAAEAEHLASAEGGLVELHGFPSPSD